MFFDRRGEVRPWLPIIGAVLIIAACLGAWAWSMKALEHHCHSEGMRVGVVGHSVIVTRRSISVVPVYGCVR